MPRPQKYIYVYIMVLILTLFIFSCSTKYNIPDWPVVKHLELYYPGGVPESLDTVYPDLQDKSLKQLTEDLSKVSKNIIEYNKKEHKSISPWLYNELKIDFNAEIQVVNNGSLQASASKEGKITIDVRVLQALFRGSLLEAFYPFEKMD